MQIFPDNIGKSFLKQVQLQLLFDPLKKCAHALKNLFSCRAYKYKTMTFDGEK